MKQPTNDDLARLRELGLTMRDACQALAAMGDAPPGKFKDHATSCAAACGKWAPFFAGLEGVEAMTLDLWFPPNGSSALSTTDIECTSPVEAMARVTAALAEADDEDEALATLVQVVNRDALFVAFQRALARANGRVGQVEEPPLDVEMEMQEAIERVRLLVPSLDLTTGMVRAWTRRKNEPLPHRKVGRDVMIRLKDLLDEAKAKASRQATTKATTADHRQPPPSPSSPQGRSLT